MSNDTSQPVYKDGLQFDHRFLEHRSFFTTLHGCIPSINYIAPLDGEKAFAAFGEAYADRILQVHTYRWYKPGRRTYQFDRTVVQFAGCMTLEFAGDYCEILHDGQQAGVVAELTAFLTRYLERRRRTPEVHVVIRGDSGPELQAVTLKRTRLDVDLYYEDDFREVDARIRGRLGKMTGKGIVLLHGLPGTGKTSYLRYLVGRLRKRVLFLSPAVAADLMSPTFLELLLANPSSVLVIEDADTILTDRRLGGGSASPVSDLLNLSDGLLADCLNIQFVCTFNSPLTTVDHALLREGRLIAQYQFGKLSQSKAQRLSDRLGTGRAIAGPATLAEVLHPHPEGAASPSRPSIGFRSAGAQE